MGLGTIIQPFHVGFNVLDYWKDCVMKWIFAGLQVFFSLALVGITPYLILEGHGKSAFLWAIMLLIILGTMKFTDTDKPE